jgi:hypothetical protein
MTKIIPRNLIQHLEWRPGQEPPTPPANPISQSTQNISSIDNLVNNGRKFYSNEKDSDNNYIGLRVALQKAINEMGSEGIISSLPYLIAGKAQADKSSNYLWKDWFTALSEEHVVVDSAGKFTNAGNSLVVVVHGQGIFTPERIQQAYDEGLTSQNAAKLNDDEVIDLLDGKLPNRESIELYTVDDVKSGNIPEPFGRYGVVVDFDIAKNKSSGYHNKSNFMDNEIVIARAGTLEHLDSYFEKARGASNNVGNWHRFTEIDPTQAQGRVLYLDINDNGLYGNINLSGDGRFVGVAPEVPR